jgi:Tfp pilus assembly protein PilN
VIGLLVVVLAFVAVYVLTSNTISQRKSQLASLQQQVAQVQTSVARFNSYAHIEQLAQQRATTVRQIASSRFDWHTALSDLSKVVPADTSLQSLVATAAPGGSAGATGGGGGIQGSAGAPTFLLKGCTGTQDEVAQLISRLRLISGVTRVTLQDSTKQGGGQSGAPVASSAPSSSGSSAGGCAANGPSFSMVIYFQPLAAAATVSGAGQPVNTAATGATK